jgi:hypothetical protein
MGENYNRSVLGKPGQIPRLSRASMEHNLHSPPRRLIELRIEHADLDSLIDQAVIEHPADELVVRRLKKRRLLLRDMIARLEAQLDPPEPA